MTPRNLLRHIFRHGAHAKSRPKVSPSEASIESLLPKSAVHTEDTVPAPAAQPSDPTEQSVLEDIVEGTNSDTRSLTDIFDALNLDIHTSKSQDLLHAILDEAVVATQLHRDTINMTLELLATLDGFSPTVPVLKEEMVLNKRMCEEKLKLLEEVERVVGQMRCGDERDAADRKGEIEAAMLK